MMVAFILEVSVVTVATLQREVFPLLGMNMMKVTTGYSGVLSTGHKDGYNRNDKKMRRGKRK